MMMQLITSIQNERVKRAAKLHRSRFRQKQDRIIVFGEREIERAIGNGIEPDELFIDESESISGAIKSCVDRFESRCFGVTSAILEKIGFGNRRDGIVMTAARPEQSFDGLLDGKSEGQSPLVAVVEGVEKPGNLGAIIRSADGAGLDALIVSDGVTDWFHPNCIRSSVGTCFGFRGCSGSNGEVQRWLADYGFDVLLAALPGESVFGSTVAVERPTAIVLGNEANGLSNRWTDHSGYRRVSIPMFGVADSLNVSAAATVLFYELARQRNRL